MDLPAHAICLVQFCITSCQRRDECEGIGKKPAQPEEKQLRGHLTTDDLDSHLKISASGAVDDRWYTVEGSATHRTQHTRGTVARSPTYHYVRIVLSLVSAS